MNQPELFMAIYILIVAVVAWRSFRCKHFWELVDKHEFPSIIEEYAKNMKEVEFNYFFSSTLKEMGIKRIVIVLRCSRCGQSQIKKIDSGP